MEPTEKELEDRLRELGTRLASPPSDVGELFFLLDQAEIYLSRVEQSPSTSMSEALRPAMNSLITKEFLNHPEVDVKVFVAACINEIIRVTAPDAPYNDALMKEIFAMIVDSFEKLDEMSGCLYSKRVCILEIMAKVRSCVIMLDLECDDLILRMFKNFLKSIRPDHPINVFFSMESIMTLILEESEDISQELLICLLSNVQNSKKGVIPVARRLAEKVISNCSMKLKPYFLAAVQSMGTHMRDYSDIVASICQGTSVALEKNEVDGNKLSERTVYDELPKESEKLDNTIKALNNGVMPLGNGNAIIEPISQELKPENSFQCRHDVAPIIENNSLGSITEKPGNELNFQYIETKSSSMQLTDASDSSRVDGDKEASASTSRRAGRKSQTTSSKSDNASDMEAEAEVFLESKREAELQPLEGLVGDNTCVNSAAPTNNSPDSGLPIRRVANLQFGDKKSTSHEPATIQMPLADNSTADVAAAGNSVGKSLKEEATIQMPLADNSTADVAAAGNSVGKSLTEEQKEVAIVVADADSSENQWKSNINQPKAKDVADKDISAEPCLKEIMVSSKASREANNVENHWVKGRRKAPREYNIDLEAVGREIEVWWPDDKMFYKGVIDAFDPVTGKHRVVYDDGDVEILLLRNERCNYIDYKNFERGQKNDIANPDSSLQNLHHHRRRRKRRGSSGRRKAGGGRNKSVRKSIPLPIQQSGDEISTQITSELGTCVNETTQIAIIEGNNISSECVSDRKDILASVGDSLGRKSKDFIKDSDDKTGPKLDVEASQISRTLNGEGVDVESSETNDSDKLKGEDTVRRRKRKLSFRH